MYATKNFPTKKALKEAVKAHQEGTGPAITVFQPGPFGENPQREGMVTFEGPHYPKPHTWYATAVLKDGHVIKVS